MTSQTMRAVWYRFVATLRRRRNGYLTVILLVGLVGGLAMGSIEAARRTQSAFPDYLVRSNASDLQVGVFPPNPSSSDVSVDAAPYQRLERTLSALAEVDRVAAIGQFFGLPMRANGTPILLNALGNQSVQTIAPLNGEYFDEDRVALAQGTMANPNRADEMVASAQAAALLGWHVGQTVRFGVFTIPQSSAPGFGTAKVRPYRQLNVKLTGLVVFQNDVVHDDVDRYPTYVLFTPAFTKLVGHAVYFPTFSIKLRGGSSQVPQAEGDIIKHIPPGFVYSFHLTSVIDGQVENSVRPESLALAVFGVIAGLAALLIGGQALVRAVRANADDLSILRAIGATRQVTIGDSLLGCVGALVLGALLAAVVAVALSPLSPIGPTRAIEISPGVTADWTVLLIGVGALLAFLGGLAIAVAIRESPRRGEASPERALSGSRTRSPALAILAGLPVAAATGFRFALERHPTRAAAPVRSALVGATLAIVVVVATLTFASGLNTLVSTPRLYGWNWDYAIEQTGGGNVPPLAATLLRADRDVEASMGFKFADPEIDGQTIPALIPQPPVSISLPIVQGHSIQNKDQIVLGAVTLRQLHKHLNDTVVLTYGSKHGVYLPPTRLRIVGIATFPAIGTSGSVHPSMGTGAMFSRALESASILRALTNKDPNLNGPAITAVKMRPGLSALTSLSSLERVANQLTKAVSSDPQDQGTFVVIGVQRPAEIVNYRSTGATSAILAGGLAVGAVAALGLTLLTSVRHRRRELALLHTLGFTRRQLATTVGWQASVAAVFGIVVGVPLGIALGRWLWDLFAQQISAVPDPTVPVVQIVLVGLSALILANLVAAIPGRIAARTSTAILLRAE